MHKSCGGKRFNNFILRSLVQPYPAEMSTQSNHLTGGIVGITQCRIAKSLSLQNPQNSSESHSMYIIYIKIVIYTMGICRVYACTFIRNKYIL